MTEFSLLGKTLLFSGLFFMVFGVSILIFGKPGFVKLPGDAVITKPGLTISIPLASSLIVSLVLTGLVNQLLH